MMMFAPDVDRGDTMATDGAAPATYSTSQTSRGGVDGNTVSFRNLLPGEPKPGFGDLRIEGLASAMSTAHLFRSRKPRA